MALSGVLSSSVTIAGLTITGSVPRSADGGLTREIPLPAGTAGTLTTRTDDDTGVATLEAGHGLSTSDVVDVYWSGGMRYGMTATVAGNAITVDLGAGDNLPAEDTAMVVTLQVQITADIDGDEVQLIVAGCDQRCHLDFQDSGTASLAAVDIAAGEMWDWAADQAIANPLTGNATADIYASNGSSSTMATLKVAALFDTTP